MKKILFLSLFILINISKGQVSNINYNSLVATEFAFAASASELGTRDAFLKFIADDGILFRPNPLNGKEFLNKAPKRPGLLSWYPAFAEVSKSGDLGFTTGPADYRRDKDSAAIWFGNFCTIWQKQSNGEWKFAIDFGIDNPKPEIKPEPLKYDLDATNRISIIRSSKKVKAVELLELDNQLNFFSAKMNLSALYKKFINKASRVLRENEFPFIGTDAICEYLNKNESKIRLSPINGKISASNDLGFTYGELRISNSVGVNDSYYYFHVWKKDGKRWILLADVTNKIQK